MRCLKIWLTASLVIMNYLQKHQSDDKRIDHLFLGKSLFDDSNIYYVADSKYYLNDEITDGPSVGKQFTYVNNILQDAMDAFNNDDKAWKNKGVYYYDPKTEGFNVTQISFCVVIWTYLITPKNLVLTKIS